MVTFNPKHRWFYFPDMETNEVLDPTAPSLAPARESIEARVLVFYRPGISTDRSGAQCSER